MEENFRFLRPQGLRSGYYSHGANNPTMSPHETAICSAHRLHGSGIGKGVVGMACLCSVPSELQLGGPEGWEWLDSWGPESSEVSSFTHLTPGPRQMTGRATCGLLVWLGFLRTWRPQGIWTSYTSTAVTGERQKLPHLLGPGLRSHAASLPLCSIVQQSVPTKKQGKGT